MLITILNRAALITGTKGFENQPLLSDQPLIALMDRYLDMDALAVGLPFSSRYTLLKAECRILSTVLPPNWVWIQRAIPNFIMCKPPPRTAKRGANGLGGTAVVVQIS